MRGWYKIQFHMVVYQALDSHPTLFDAQLLPNGFGNHHLPFSTYHMAHEFNLYALVAT